LTKSTNWKLSLSTEAQEETTPKGIVQYISRFCTLHKKSGGGLRAKGSTDVRNEVGEVRKKERKGGGK
jgi:hypothetical protein